MILKKKFSFDAAHSLTNHPGKCKNLHGHTYVLEVSITGKINNETGMILDFDVLKKIVQNLILERLDHRFLNDIIEPSTAENIAKWIWDVLAGALQKYKVELYSLKLCETSTSCVIYRNTKF